MPNLRIVSDNALERAATLTASTTAGALAAANLVNWKKSSVHRAIAALVTYAATWAVAEPISCVALPFCNLSPTATMRVRLSNEAAAVNLVRYCETFDNGTYWGTSGASVVAAAGIPSPSGSLNVDKLQESTTVAEAHWVHQNISGFVTGDQITFSIFAKQAERGFMSLKFDAASTAAPLVASVIFSLSTGTKYSESANGWTFSIESFPNGWWRVFATRTATANGLVKPMVCTASSSTNSTPTGVVGSGIYIWGAMLNKGGKSSYYPNLVNATSSTKPAGYIDSWQSYDYDSGTVQACPWPAPRLRGFTPAQAASAYAYGGGTYARHWLPAEVSALGIAVDVNDPDNLQGYVEVACMVVGPYWSPKYNAAAMPLTILDGSENIVTGGGDTCGELGFISKEIGVDLTSLTPADRIAVVSMARSSSAYPILISGFPGDAESTKERDYMAYATRSKSSEIGIRHAEAYQTKVTFKEV